MRPPRKQFAIALIVFLSVSALAQTITHGVTLTWTWTGTGTATFNVYRSVKAGAETQPALATGIASPTYNDGAAVLNTTYYYTVTAVVGGTESAPSTEVSAQIVPPNAPANPATSVH